MIDSTNIIILHPWWPSSYALEFRFIWDFIFHFYLWIWLGSRWWIYDNRTWRPNMFFFFNFIISYWNVLSGAIHGPLPCFASIKNHISTNYYLSCDRIVQPVSFWMLNDTKRYTFFGFSIELLPFFVQNMDKDYTTKTLKQSIVGLFPFQAYFGVMFFTANVGLLFNMWMLQLTASGQKHFGIAFLDNILRTMFKMYDFFFHKPHFIVVYKL